MWWRALGLEPTADKEAVKNAYVGLIKTIDQDKDIETFTNVHHSYRIAMKSFKKEERKIKEGLIDFVEADHWYIVELAKIYNNPKRRLNTYDWKNLFACMSFIEEKHFLTQYVAFFNEHYALTESIWQLVEKYYPLSNRGEFRWPELVKGHMTVTDQEIEGLSFDKASNYVTYKIHCFYAIIDGDYNRAMTFIEILMQSHTTVDILRWYLLCTIELHQEEKIRDAYQGLLEADKSSYMAHYLYCGYLIGLNKHNEAALILEAIPSDEKDSRISEMLHECNNHVVSKQHVQSIQKPWLELALTTIKAQKHLLKGDYSKALEGNTGSRLKLWGRR